MYIKFLFNYSRYKAFCKVWKSMQTLLSSTAYTQLLIVKWPIINFKIILGITCSIHMCKPCYLPKKVASTHTVNIHHTSDPINTKEKTVITKPKLMDHYTLVQNIYKLQESCTVNHLYFASYIHVGICFGIKVILEYKTASANVKLQETLPQCIY